MASEKSHYIFRVGDGNNFRNSIHPFWGVKAGRNDCIKGFIKKFQPGDVLWFMTSKPYGGKIIAMSEFKEYYDRRDEPLIKIHTLSNEEQNWEGAEDDEIPLRHCVQADTCGRKDGVSR